MMLRWLPLTVVMAAGSSAWAASEPKLVAWPDLMPKADQPIMPEDLDFGGDDAASADQTFDPDLGGVVQHGMSPITPDSDDAMAVVDELDEVQVKIAGYVLPLDFESTTIKEFLLVPYVGACIHVPPPPPNQIIYVTSEDGIKVGGMYEPVWATGTLQTSSTSNEFADVGYTMTLEVAEPYEY